MLGITGSPGVGKSTLTNAIAAELRARDRSVAILAVDPSSPFSGGALLGDRVRMQGHHADPDVFIRSMASRGHLGGLSFATPQAVLVLDAAGFDDVIVETVGVGQSEVEIAATADTTVVAMAPGMGDSVQAAKAGILEVADVFVINKADASGAGKLESELRSMLELGRATAGRSTADLLEEHPDLLDHHPELADDLGDDADLVPRVAASGWWPPILRTVAVRGEGIADARGRLRRARRPPRRLRPGRRARPRPGAAHHPRDRARADPHPLRPARRAPQARSSAARRAIRCSTRWRRRSPSRELDPYAAADELLDALEGGRA